MLVSSSRGWALCRTGLVIGFLLVWGSAAQALPLLISEIFYDAESSDDGHVFVELAGNPGTSLDGLVLEGVNGFDGSTTTWLELSGEISETGVFVVADVTGGGATFVENADLLAEFDFQNGPDSVVLWSAAQTVLDAVGYGAFSPVQIFAGEGAPAPDARAGSSLARLFADLDTDDNATDFEILYTPTPGTAEFLAIPEPSTALLMGAALAALAYVRRGFTS
ncbi:MAG: PEP-CTERM sorting domain-containing protein [Myxococcota bacterium]